jgi:dTDP-4-amino-4,6-dideoxygalactose transaminase
MRKISTIDLSYENQFIKAEFFDSLSTLYDSNQLTDSPVIEELETRLAEACGSRFCNLTGAGTMALQLAASACGIVPGDEVIVPANSFLASAVAMHHAGAKIILADVDPYTWNLSAATVRRVITPRTKAICLVHLYGNVADPEEFAEFGVPVIEDASHAFSGTLRGKKVGSLGSIAGFSAGPIKGFGGLGHAGFITYDNEEWRPFLNAYINNGQTSRHYAAVVGHNFRIDPVNALFLQCKLDHWGHLLERRKNNISILDSAFDLAGIQRQKRLSDGDASLWVYVIRCDAGARDRIVGHLKKQCGIETLVQYTYTINQQPIWKELAAKAADVPVSENLIKEIFSVPIHAGVLPDDAERIAHDVINAVKFG